MKFELNDYHRNVSDEELLRDVKDTAQKLGKVTLTTDEYTKNGKYHHSTVMRRFGSWKKVLQLSGLETRGHNFKINFTDEQVKDDLWRVAGLLGSNTVKIEEYNIHGQCSSSVLERKYGSWNKVLEMAGLELTMARNFSNEDLLTEIERVWITLGRQPTSEDIKRGISKYSLQSYARRFGGWRGALQAFVDWVDTDDDAETKQEKSEGRPVVSDVKAEPENVDICTHTTSRDINLRLRFRVMQRDNFKCCACGASPAKDPAVELHIDHIIPWSKGGETVMENLQTLCAKCNLGKSDLM